MWVVRIRGSTLSFLTKIVNSFLIDWDCSFVHCQRSAFSLLIEIACLSFVKDQLFPFWLRLFICTLSRINSFLIDWDCSSVLSQWLALSLLTEITRCSSVHHHPYLIGHYWVGIYQGQVAGRDVPSLCTMLAPRPCDGLRCTRPLHHAGSFSFAC